jgi:hypothetical protein
MAQAALQEEFTFPAGGIADFYKDDEELAAMDREDAQRAFGNNGIANFQDVATRMASYGRYGDDKLVHAETGELIVPKALIEDNPKLRDSIFGHLRDMGIEDPERYVVGSRANSINPDTGLPEFFLKNLFKKVSKAVKKVSKKVVKLVKKAAPVIIPIALNTLFPGMGYIYQGALGAGIGTLVQGGSIKDAFKNALIGGAIGGATAGISGGLNAAPGQTFSQGAVSGIKDAARLSNLTTAGQQLASGQFGQAGFDAVTDAQNIADLGAVPDTAIAPSDTVSQATDFGAGQGPLTAAERLDLYGADANRVAFEGSGPVSSYGPDPMSMTDANMFASGVPDPALANVQAAQTLPNPVSDSGILETFKDYGSKASDLLFGQSPTQDAIGQRAGELMKNNPGVYTSETALAAATKELTPGVMRKFLPSVALAGGATYLAGGFEAPEVPEEDLGPTGPDLLRLTPYEYLIGQQNLRTRGSQGRTVVPTAYAAEGGEIFPRRVGGIMPNEGTPGKDSVRAMLMPGEFVMTTDAVKGLGNGDNDKGISNMYQMMRGLEAKGRAMA